MLYQSSDYQCDSNIMTGELFNSMNAFGTLVFLIFNLSVDETVVTAE